MDYHIFYINGFLLSVVLTLSLQRMASQIGLVDSPAGRKIHDGYIPLIGGLSMYFAFVLTTVQLARYYVSVAVPPYLLIGLAILVISGMIDDFCDLRPILKGLIQVVAVVLIFVPKNILLQDLGNLFGIGNIVLSYLAVPFTIFSAVGLINAINMLDGLDGLAGGFILVALLWLAVAAAVLDQTTKVVQIMVLASVVLGFLIFNMRHYWRPRATVFMGDAGSMMLGSALAWFAVNISQSRGSGGELNIAPVYIAWVLALPVIDTLSLCVRRIAQGKNPLVGDREHLHHIVLQAGFPIDKGVYLLVTVSAVLGGIGMAGWYFQAPEGIMFFGLLAPILLHSWFVCRGSKFKSHARSRVKDGTYVHQSI